MRLNPFRRHHLADALSPYEVGVDTLLALHTREKGTALRSTSTRIRHTKNVTRIDEARTALRLVPVLVDDVTGDQLRQAASRPTSADEALNRAREVCEAARWPEQHPDECLWCQYVMATRPTLFTALPDDAA